MPVSYGTLLMSLYSLHLYTKMIFVLFNKLSKRRRHLVFFTFICLISLLFSVNIFSSSIGKNVLRAVLIIIRLRRIHEEWQKTRMEEWSPKMGETCPICGKLEPVETSCCYCNPRRQMSLRVANSKWWLISSQRFRQSVNII